MSGMACADGILQDMLHGNKVGCQSEFTGFTGAVSAEGFWYFSQPQPETLA